MEGGKKLHAQYFSDLPGSQKEEGVRISALVLEIILLATLA